jgi:hypothetical protein
MLSFIAEAFCNRITDLSFEQLVIQNVSLAHSHTCNRSKASQTFSFHFSSRAGEA